MTNEYNTGNTKRVSNNALAIPPTMGAAIRLIISAPVPDENKIGIRPSIIDSDVIIIGLSRCIAPSTMARLSSSGVTADSPVQVLFTSLTD